MCVCVYLYVRACMRVGSFSSCRFRYLFAFLLLLLLFFGCFLLSRKLLLSVYLLGVHIHVCVLCVYQMF